MKCKSCDEEIEEGDAITITDSEGASYYHLSPRGSSYCYMAEVIKDGPVGLSKNIHERIYK